MKVTVEDYTRDEQREFASSEAAVAWLRTNREATLFSPRSDGVIDCWEPNSSRPIARIIQMELHAEDMEA